MNLEEEIQLQGIACQQDVAGYTFICLLDGTQFPGRIDPQPSIDPRLNLGSDTREYAVIYLLRSDYPTSLVYQGRISQVDPTVNQAVGEWMFVNRDDNPGDPTEIKLWVTKVTPQDQ